MTRRGRPLQALAEAIIEASLASAQSLRGEMDSVLTGGAPEDRLAVALEFVYFFLHLANRAAHGVLGGDGRRELRGALEPLVLSPIVESLFDGLSHEQKVRLATDLGAKLAKTEADYALCKELVEGEGSFDGPALFSRLAENVVRVLNLSKSPVTMTLVVSLALDGFNRMDLTRLVSDAGEELGRDSA